MTSKIDRHVEEAGKDSLVHPPLSPPAISTLHEDRFDLVSHFAPCEDELRDRQLDQSNSVARQVSSHGLGEKSELVMDYPVPLEATVVPTSKKGHGSLRNLSARTSAICCRAKSCCLNSSNCRLSSNVPTPKDPMLGDLASPLR
jgi:hypothetical protein